VDAGNGWDDVLRNEDARSMHMPLQHSIGPVFDTMQCQCIGIIPFLEPAHD